MHRSNWSEFLLLIITIHTMKHGFMYHLSSEPFCTLNWRAQFVHPEKKIKEKKEVKSWSHKMPCSQNTVLPKNSTENGTAYWKKKQLGFGNPPCIFPP